MYATVARYKYADGFFLRFFSPRGRFIGSSILHAEFKTRTEAKQYATKTLGLAVKGEKK